jgi:hypothetical protein
LELYIDADDFRRERFYTQPMDAAIRRNETLLRLLYGALKKFTGIFINILFINHAFAGQLKSFVQRRALLVLHDHGKS